MTDHISTPGVEKLVLKLKNQEIRDIIDYK